MMGWKWTEDMVRQQVAKFSARAIEAENWQFRGADIRQINDLAPRAKDKVRQISEKVFMGEVRKAALMNGWRYYHTFNSMRSTEGFPDCVLVHAGKRRLIFAELKSEAGKMTTAQQEWIDDLNELNYEEGGTYVEVYVWRPSQIDEIWEILRR